MAKSFFKKIEDEIVDEAEEFIKEKVEKKAIRIGELSVFAVTAYAMFVLGITHLLERFFPVLQGGYSYILMGGVFLIMFLIINNSKE
jgi:hypothetical protein